MRPLVLSGEETLPVDEALYMLLAARDLVESTAWPRGSGRVRTQVEACLDRIAGRVAALYSGAAAVELLAEAAAGSCTTAQKALGKVRGKTLDPLRSCLASLALQLRKLSDGRANARGLPC
jgi:hypothetical protein